MWAINCVVICSWIGTGESWSMSIMMVLMLTRGGGEFNLFRLCNVRFMPC
jgi:hypothetical protein